MTEQELKSLHRVIQYLWRDEQKNFEECELNDGKAPDDHIFRDVKTLDRYLPCEQAAGVSPSFFRIVGSSGNRTITRDPTA